MNKDYYTKEVIDLKDQNINSRLSAQDTVLEKILEQVNKTNGKVILIQKIILVIGSVTATLLIVDGSQFVQFIAALVK